MRIPLVLRRSLSTVILGLWSLCVSAQPAAVGVGEPIIVGQRFHMRETRAYQVSLPANYSIGDARYPVLIVLDGEEHFQHVSATVDFLAAAGKIPAMIVVGVPNTDRVRDMDSAAASGSSTFLTFVRDELIPKIDHDYRTHPYRILVGHSDAALFTLYAMINAPEVFRGYIAIAPAFGGNPELPKTVAAFLNSHEAPLLNADLFIAADDSTGQPLSGAWELASYLQDRASRVRDLRFTFRRYPEESHSSIPLRSVQDGLLNIFEGWEIEDPFALYGLGGLAAIDKHFAALSARLGFPVAVPEEALLGPFYELEGRKRFAEAEGVIARVIESFPDSPAALYYAGRLYLQMGNRPRAIEALRKSLLLSPNYGASRSLLEYMKVNPNELVPEVP
jgi:predicted alpha/beta superfamily hydrolase